MCKLHQVKEVIYEWFSMLNWIKDEKKLYISSLIEWKVILFEIFNTFANEIFFLLFKFNGFILKTQIDTALWNIGWWRIAKCFCAIFFIFSPWYVIDNMIVLHPIQTIYNFCFLPQQSTIKSSIFSSSACEQISSMSQCITNLTEATLC